MYTIQLTPDEHQLLQEIIESVLSDLRVEIVGTDRVEFKEALKQRKQTMLDIFEKLQEAKTVSGKSGHG